MKRAKPFELHRFGLRKDGVWLSMFVAAYTTEAAAVTAAGFQATILAPGFVYRVWSELEERWVQEIDARPA